MAGVPIMISGVLWDKHWKAGRSVVLYGVAHNPELEVGGGPIYPSDGPPLGIWGPTDPRPSHPIAEPPWGWGNQPPVIWGPGDPRPQPPIVIPPPPIEPPTEPIPPGEGIKPPPPGGGWGYSPTYGWGYFPGVGGKPQPPGGQPPQAP